MPEKRAPEVLVEADLEQSKLKLALQSLTDAEALATVNQTFAEYERYRTTNHDKRWTTHDALYVGWVPQKMWDNTNIPRASLSHMTTFDHVETALPAIEEALFRSGESWFQVEPEPGAEQKEAQAIQNFNLYSFDSCKGRVEVSLAVKSVLLHGNGGLELYWDQGKNMWACRWVDIRDFYIDPATPTPSIDDARSVIRRKKMTVADLEALRGFEGMDLPEQAVLNYLADNSSTTLGDQTKRNSQALRGVNFNPSQWDTLPTPADKTIEVLIYYSNARVIWVLERKVVVYNQKNPYGFIPFCFAPCFNYLGSFYSISYADVLESNQRYGEAMRNAHLDSRALALMPPRVSKRGSNVTPAAEKWYPGAHMKVADAKDVALLQPENGTVNVMDDLMALDIMSEKHTGVNSVGMGVPRGGNANRTAGGMQTQVQGGASRLSKIVKNIEDYMLVPLLEKAYKMTQLHMDPSKLVSVLGEENKFIQVGAEAFAAPVRFKMLAASKMLTQEKLAQMFPFVAQYLLQGPLVERLQTVGMTVDVGEMLRMLQDATGTARAYELVRPLNEQEKQAMNTPPPEVMAKMQQQQASDQTRLAMGQMKVQGDMQKQAAEIADREKDRALEREKQDEESAREFLKLAMTGQQDEAKVAAEMAKSKVQLQTMREKAQLDRQMREQDMFLKAIEGKQKIQLQAEQNEADRQLKQVQTQDMMEQSRVKTESMTAQEATKMMLMRRRGEQDLKFQQKKADQDFRNSARKEKAKADRKTEVKK